MTLSKAMVKKLNEQITHEFDASHTYLGMSCYFDAQGLKVLAGYFRRQSEEERAHALKIVDYMQDVGAAVALDALARPPASYADVRAAVAAALDHEREVTGQISALASLAEKDHDYATRSFLNWFIDEQVEEERSMSDLLRLVDMAGDNLLQLEAHLARLKPPHES